MKVVKQSMAESNRQLSTENSTQIHTNEQLHRQFVKNQYILIKQSIASIKQRLESNPANKSDWLLLARQYKLINDYSKASQAMQKVIELDKNNADYLVEYVNLRAQASYMRFDRKSIQVLNRALQINNNHQMALYLIGKAYQQQGNDQLAETSWKKLLSIAPENSVFAKLAQKEITKIKIK